MNIWHYTVLYVYVNKDGMMEMKFKVSCCLVKCKQKIKIGKNKDNIT